MSTLQRRCRICRGSRPHLLLPTRQRRSSPSPLQSTIMFEAEKTNRVRGPDFVERFMSGTVLDIGSGRDLAVPHARPFDKQHGDANHIARYLPPESFDCVHSSHCLEHMRSPQEALAEWWSLVQPGGSMILLVPEENLYEQGHWPSLFNSDHKWTFRLG